MTERPIPFSAPMVRALLDGSKTQTRRVVKPQHLQFFDQSAAEMLGSWNTRPMPYGHPGDRLWVREAWTTHACFDDIPPRDLTTRSLHYQADGQIKTGKNRPGMFMPRWASRITLEITRVRVERLHAINEVDAIAEGAQWAACGAPQEGSHKAGYAQLWESINGPGSWEQNPWVWVIEFKKVTP